MFTKSATHTCGLYFLYIYSFSLLNALFMAYGLGDSAFIVGQLVKAVLPSLLVVCLIMLIMPYSFLLESFVYIWATIWNIGTIGQAIMTKTIMDTPSINIILSTSASEARSFVDLGFSFKLIAILCFVALLPLLILYIIREKNKFNPKKIYVFVLLLTSLVLMLSPINYNATLYENIKIENLKLSNIDRNVRKLFFIEYPTRIPEAIQMGQLNTYVPENIIAKIDGAQNVILVVLESSNRNNFSIYGYERKTNPKLEQKELYIYNDVISPSAVTMYSIPYMYTFQSLKEHAHITTIYDLFAGAGFETHLFEGYPASRPNDIIFHIAKRAQTIHKKEGLDKDLFDKALHVIENNKEKKNLLVIQTMAAHYTYKDQYPKNYTTFSDTPPNLFPNADAQLRNEYDTAILYIDEIISDFIDSLDETSNTILIVTTDHGEEVGHYATINTGRTNSTKLLSCFEIPLFIWASKEYKKSLENLVFDTTRPYQTDNLIHSIIDLAHIKTPLFKPELSLFNKEYKEQVRTVQGSEYNVYKAKVDKEREKNISK